MKIYLLSNILNNGYSFGYYIFLDNFISISEHHLWNNDKDDNKDDGKYPNEYSRSSSSSTSSLKNNKNKWLMNLFYIYKHVNLAHNKIAEKVGSIIQKTLVFIKVK